MYKNSPLKIGNLLLTQLFLAKIKKIPLKKNQITLSNFSFQFEIILCITAFDEYQYVFVS